MNKANRAVAEKMRQLFAEALGQGRLELIDSLFSPDFIDHSTPDQEPGYAGVKAYFSAIRDGFPDIQVSIDDLIVQGEKVALRTTWRGTHLGIYEGVSPTGQSTARTLIQIFRIVDNLITEEWNEGPGMLDGFQEQA